MRPKERIFTSVTKRSQPKMKRVPSEKKRKDVKKYTVDDLTKSRLTFASREGRSTMKSTGPIRPLPEDDNNDGEVGLMSCSIHGASKGKLSDYSPTRATPTPETKKKGKRKGRSKRFSDVKAKVNSCLKSKSRKAVKGPKILISASKPKLSQNRPQSVPKNRKRLVGKL